MGGKKDPALYRRRRPIRVVGGDAFLDLGRGYEAVIDAADVAIIQGHRWRAHLGKHGHAYACARIGGVEMLLHRVILDAQHGQYVDHIDGDGFNNRRSNIRICTQLQNMANRVADRRNRLGIKGVSAENGKFIASITPNGRKIRLGRFNTPEEAAAAYKGAARVLWGDFAK